MRRFVAFTNEYPWRWMPSHIDEWTLWMIAEAPGTVTIAAIRPNAVVQRVLCRCPLRLGGGVREAVWDGHPSGSDLPRVEHDPGSERLRRPPEARPFTREEMQRFLDYADDQVERAVRAKRKGALAAYRDATVFKVSMGGGCGERRRRSWT